MAKTLAEIQASIESKLEEDVDFQNSLVDLDEDEKTQKLAERKQEEIYMEIARLNEEADSAKKLTEVTKNQKIRAEKAEAELRKIKGTKPKEDEKKPEGLSQFDLLAIVKNNVDEEDVQEVIDYAQLKGTTVSEALKTSFMKSRLASLAEERETAKAANVKKTPGGQRQSSGASLLDKARSKGEMPDTDEGMRKLAKARLGIKE